MINIKELQEKLNNYWIVKDAEIYRFTVERIEDRENVDRIVVKCWNDDEIDKEMVWLLGVNDNNDTAAMVDDLIKEMFEKYINPRNKIVKGYKGFCYRKINSLDKAINKGDTDKVTQINLELVERYKIMKKNKNEVDFYKLFIRSFYSIKE